MPRSILKNINKLYRLPRKCRMYFYIFYNRFVFYTSGVHFGRNMRVINKCYLLTDASASIRIGENFMFTSGDSFNPLSRNIRGCIYAAHNAKITIANNVGISSASIWAKKSITIGNNVNIGADCILLDTDAHSLDYTIRRHPLEDREVAKSFPIVIEDDVLIGTRCIILKGVRIGARSVIGSGSVVTKDIPADCVAAGNPARVLKKIEVSQ